MKLIADARVDGLLVHRPKGPCGLKHGFEMGNEPAWCRQAGLRGWKGRSQIMGIPESCPLKRRRGMKWVSARGQQAAFRIGAGWDGGGKEKRLKAVGPCPASQFCGCAAAQKAAWVEMRCRFWYRPLHCHPPLSMSGAGLKHIAIDSPPARIAWMEIAPAWRTWG